MIILIKIILLLGMVAFPVIYSVMGGSAKIELVKGFSLGVRFERKIYGVEQQMEDDSIEESTHVVDLLYFSLGFFQVLMAWSKKIENE